jgi:hypothetical protein
MYDRFSRSGSTRAPSFPREPSPMAVAGVTRALRAGEEVSDDAIDLWLAEPYRCVSRRFWTPVEVGRTAARWIEDQGAERVLDVGAGAGKFCVVSALATNLRMTGIEQRHHLVVEASNLAHRFRVEHRCRMLLGTLERVDLAAFDALYVFNSFAENVYPRHEQLDDRVELSARRLRDDLRTVEAALARMALGAALVTYHGFGGVVPDTFDLVRDEQVGSGSLRLWVKRRARATGGCWVEIGDDVQQIDGIEPSR